MINSVKFEFMDYNVLYISVVLSCVWQRCVLFLQAAVTAVHHRVAVFINLRQSGFEQLTSTAESLIVLRASLLILLMNNSILSRKACLNKGALLWCGNKLRLLSYFHC